VSKYANSSALSLVRATDQLFAILFGSGNSCPIIYTDDQRDGVANNHEMPTADPAGHCNARNTHTSVVADDDGESVRRAVLRQIWVRQPFALPNR
jgi:hypothetical protein